MTHVYHRLVLLLGLLLAGVAGAQDSLDVTRLDELPGIGVPEDAALADSFVYTASYEHGLSIIDATDPLALRVIAQSPDFSAHCVRVAGDLVLAGGLVDGVFELWSIADRRHPQLLYTETTGHVIINEIAVVDTIAYFFDDYGCRIYSLAHPAAPVPLAERTHSFHVVDAELVGGSLCGIGGDDAGFFWTVLDLTTDPLNPAPVAHEALGVVWPYAVTVRDTLACIAADEDGVRILNIRDPLHPVPVATVALEGAALSVAHSGGDVIVTGWSSGQPGFVAGIHLANPAAPYIAWGFPLPDVYALVAADRSLACVATSECGVGVFAVPPETVQYYDAPSSPIRLAARDTLLFAATDDAHPLDVLSIADPAHPVQIGTTEDTRSIFVTSSDIALHGNRVFVVDNCYLYAYDTADPTSLALLRRIDLDWPNSTQLGLRDDVLFVMAYNRLWTYSTDPGTLLEPLGSCSLAAATGLSALCLFDTVAYLAGRDGLFAVDIRDPAAPQPLGHWPHRATELARWRDYLLTNTAWDEGGHQSPWLRIFESAAAGSPTRVDSVDVGQTAGALQVEGDYLIVTGTEGLTLFNISDLPTLHPAGYYHGVSGGSRRATVLGDVVYTPTRRGITIYRAAQLPPLPSAVPVPPATRPQRLTLHPCYPNPFNARTTISFALPQTARAVIDVFDITGRRASRLSDAVYAAGEHQLSFDAQGLASGIYFVHLQAGDATRVAKLMLVR